MSGFENNSFQVISGFCLKQPWRTFLDEKWTKIGQILAKKKPIPEVQLGTTQKVVSKKDLFRIACSLLDVKLIK